MSDRQQGLPAKDQLVALGRLTPPLDPVTEGEALHLFTGFLAVLEFGPEIVEVLDADDPHLAIAQRVTDARDEEVTGPLTATGAPPPTTPGVAVPAVDPRDAEIERLQEQLAAAQGDQVAAAERQATQVPPSSATPSPTPEQVQQTDPAAQTEPAPAPDAEEAKPE